MTRRQKVYILGHSWEGLNTIFGVFGTAEAAQKFAFRHAKKVGDPEVDTIPRRVVDLEWNADKAEAGEPPRWRCEWDDMEYVIEQRPVRS